MTHLFPRKELVPNGLERRMTHLPHRNQPPANHLPPHQPTVMAPELLLQLGLLMFPPLHPHPRPLANLPVLLVPPKRPSHPPERRLPLLVKSATYLVMTRTAMILAKGLR